MNFAESKSFFRQLLQKHSVFQAPWNRPLFSETQSLENIPYLKNAVPKHKAVAGPIRSPHKRSFPNVCGGRKKEHNGPYCRPDPAAPCAKLSGYDFSGHARFSMVFYKEIPLFIQNTYFFQFFSLNARKRTFYIKNKPSAIKQ